MAEGYDRKNYPAQPEKGLYASHTQRAVVKLDHGSLPSLYLADRE